MTPGLAFSQLMAGGSEPRPLVLSCPNTSRVVGMGKDTCLRGCHSPSPVSSWILTRARVIGGPWGPGPCWNHTLHPLGFSRVVKAQEGGLAQTQHAACRDSNHLATPTTTLARLRSAPKSQPCPHSVSIQCISVLRWSPVMSPTAKVRVGKITDR